MAHLLAGALGVALIVVVLLEVFEMIVLPRRVTRHWRLTRLFYRGAWTLWQRFARLRRTPRARENALSAYGPLAVFVLLGSWVLLIVVGFALQWSGGSSLSAGGEKPDFWVDLYFSATTFLTLGLGDVTPHPGGLARAVLIGRRNAQVVFGGKIEEERPRVRIVEADNPRRRALQDILRALVKRVHNVAVVRAVPRETVNRRVEIDASVETARPILRQATTGIDR